MSGAYENDFLALKRNAVVPELRIPGYSFDEAAIYCKEKYDKKGSVLFVVNTKRAAFEIYERVKTLCDPAVKVVYLSTNLCPERRRRKIAQIKQSLIMEKKDLSNEHTDRNKSGFPKGGIICITTQLIEAGVDVSFPCVIRSVAGLDHIAQAAGRCNRNDEYPGDSEVYIINLQEENISGLKEILTGQQITNTIIRNVQQEQLLSVETMSRYYELYFRMWKDKLSYEINDYGCQTELLKLLSLNNDRWNMKRAESPWWHRQAAKTAGMFFQVIDTATVPVLVPDNEESKNLISILKGEMFSWELQQTLRKAQKYLVEIYPQTEKKLIELQAIEKLPCGLYVLQEEYYDPDIGIVTEGKQMELLMY